MLLLFFPLADTPLSILLLAFLLLLVDGDALFDVALQTATQMDRKLGQLERHLVVVVTLGEFGDDLNDALGLLGCERVDLSDQVVSLFNSERFLLHGDGRRG